MSTLLASVVLAFTGQPVAMHCPQRYTGYVERQRVWNMSLPRWVCRDLLDGRPRHLSVALLAHEITHINYPRLGHGGPFSQRARRLWGPLRLRLCTLPA